MHGFADSRLASAVSSAGGYGTYNPIKNPFILVQQYKDSETRV